MKVQSTERQHGLFHLPQLQLIVLMMILDRVKTLPESRYPHSTAIPTASPHLGTKDRRVNE